MIDRSRYYNSENSYSWIRFLDFNSYFITNINDYEATDGFEIRINIETTQINTSSGRYCSPFSANDQTLNLTFASRMWTGGSTSKKFSYYKGSFGLGFYSSFFYTYTDYIINGKWAGNDFTVTINGVNVGTQTYPAMTANSAQVIYLNKDIGRPLQCFTGKVYYFRILNPAGVAKHNFIPAMNNGVITMFDTITQTYMTPSGNFEIG